MKPYYIALIADKMLGEFHNDGYIAKQLEHAKRFNSTEDARGWAKVVIEKTGFAKEALTALVKVRKVTVTVEDTNG